MNDIMEKLIKNNREKLMSDLPAGHRERFAMKMMSQRDNETMRQRVDVTTIGRTRRLWLGIASAAAVSLILILINKQETIQPYIYEESEKMAEMRMLYETQLNETIVMLENVLMNVTTTTAKIMASSQSSRTLCFSPSLYSFFQNSHFTLRVMW